MFMLLPLNSMNFLQILSANNKSREIIQQNCIYCHADFAQTAINATTNPHAHDSLKYISCHKDVGHKHGI